jgi:hypothetical protein
MGSALAASLDRATLPFQANKGIFTSIRILISEKQGNPIGGIINSIGLREVISSTIGIGITARIGWSVRKQAKGASCFRKSRIVKQRGSKGYTVTSKSLYAQIIALEV